MRSLIDKIRHYIIISFIVILTLGCTACGSGKEDRTEDLLSGKGFASFDVSSGSLHDGVWDTAITNTANGDNLSPQLSWDAVDGAESYVIYMADTTAGNWIHWKSGVSSYTDLPEGQATADEYIGPYPPSGTHVYEIFVVAVSKSPGSLPGDFDTSDPAFKDDLLSLDTDPDGNEGNILAYGHISGTYTHGE